jgi:hypothetical protein
MEKWINDCKKKAKEEGRKRTIDESAQASWILLTLDSIRVWIAVIVIVEESIFSNCLLCFWQLALVSRKIRISERVIIQ